MGIRITTWNVNGIRNPFSYSPWREKRSLAVMFDILEADIVVFQETKIQRKDLRDDMVLIPGWDCFFSLPKQKKGYSGVVIYTRQSICAPIRAEEGITGVLCPPTSATSFSELPEDQQIGGYPTLAQASDALEDSSLVVDFVTLDSEGRCVILEFPAFILIGVYSPANRDDTRDGFRLGFLNLLDLRVRNLVALGKRVVLAGDLNISKEELDTANAESAMRKNSMTAIEYYSSPARSLFNHLLDDGKVYGTRDKKRESPVLWDICRGFHPNRKGMFTCWEQKVNARPGNFGSRIDYVLCSLDMKGWFSDSNIQEGLLGSDHCPVYAILKDKVEIDKKLVDIRDIMNPIGMFHDGVRSRGHSASNMLLLSGKLIPEFDRRQNISDMFRRKPLLQEGKHRLHGWTDECYKNDGITLTESECRISDSEVSQLGTQLPTAKDSSSVSKVLSVAGNLTGCVAIPVPRKRTAPEKQGTRVLKRVKSGSTGPLPRLSSKGQQTLNGFFKAKPITFDKGGCPVAAIGPRPTRAQAPSLLVTRATSQNGSPERDPNEIEGSILEDVDLDIAYSDSTEIEKGRVTVPPDLTRFGPSKKDDVAHDPVESRETWSRIFTKPAAPQCEGHDEPCISLMTKKNGLNQGRSFWLCARPLGPTGQKERNTQWRCQTFIWCSDWNPGGVVG